MSNPFIRLSLPRAAASWLPGLALMIGLVASGDRSVWSAGGANLGIDPLEILNLAVRANAILVLDSSGSMGETTAGNAGLADDDPDAKLGSAKKVLRDIIAANQTKVSFQFGIYDQGPSTIAINTQTAQSTGGTRFQYTVKNATFTTEPPIQLRLFEVPVGSNWTVAFANGTTNYTTAAIPSKGVNQAYTGTELAQTIAALMNAQDGSGYVGTFSDPANTNGQPVFTFTRTSGTGVFTMKFSLMNATLRGLLRAVTTDSNDATAPFVIVPNLGSFTTVTSTSAPPNSFVVTGGPTIRIGRGGTNFSGTLTNATYTGAALATHIASVMGTIDAGATSTGPPNSFVITGGPAIRIKRGASTFSGNLTNATYTGAALATHIATVMDTIDTGTAAVATHTGTYNTATGVFTFVRSGTDTTNAFEILWSNWAASLKGVVGASGGIGAPAANASDPTSAPYSLSTAGGLTPVTTTNDVYGGSYNAATGVFTFTRAGTSGASFDILWSNWTSSLQTLIAAPGSNASDPTTPFTLSTNAVPPVTTTTIGSTTTSTGPATSTAPLVLYRRSDSGTYDLTDSGNRFLSAFANKYFNGETLSVLADGTPCFLTPGTPVTNPAVPPITVELRAAGCGAVVAGNTMTFLLRGASSISAPGNDCGGFRSLVGLSPCVDNDQFVKIATPYLDPELALSGSSIIGYSENNATGGGGTQPTQGSRDAFGVLTPGGGIRAAQNTPIAESLIDIRTIFTTGIGAQPNSGTPGVPVPFILPLPSVRAIWPIIASQTRKQKTFVIFVTDGDDTCEDAAGGNQGLGGDGAALRAAHKAQQLYAQFVPGVPESSVTTYVIAFGTGAAINRANWIAWGGSGMKFGPAGPGVVAPTTGTGAQERWSRIPTQAESDACVTCQDAIPAVDPSALSTALQSVIDQGQTSGEFSDQQSITESVYEYVDLAPSPTPNPTVSPIVTPSPYVPLDPQTRYDSSIPVLLQSTFVLPAFDGHLKAFRNVGGVSTQLWDAGAKLVDRVVNDSGAMGPTGKYTFAQLYGNATSSTVRASSARIKRRIFTTSGQGVLGGYTAQNLLSDNASVLQGNRIELWPPAAAVAPTANNPAPAGSLDEALGLGASVTTVAQVQALFSMACLPSSDATPRIHPDCTSGTASVQLARAKREAREAFLAYLAGARVSNVSGKPDRLTTGEVLFQARPWIMFESTLAAPAVVTPPLEAEPLTYHPGEYRLYRDGPRDGSGHAVNGIANGLGLRNPDKENPQTVAATDNFSLKPQMSVVYHATNQGLHAFRAGPCPTTGVSGGFTSLGTLNCAGETGGEELWAFVPFDQLGKLRSLLKVQSRSSKTYLIAAPVRISDVFVAGTATQTIGGVAIGAAGVWRTIAVFGRGIAGKSLTALDVTVPGPFTSHSLETRPPIVIWSRGNFDTSDGLVKSGSNTYNHDAADYTAYLGMGETWSVPAVGFVKPSLHITGRRPAGVEFALYLGSGYSDVSTEGKTFFSLDALSGDVLQSFPLPNGTVVQSGLTLPNVITGSPSIYTVESSTQKSPQGFVGITAFLSNPVEAQAKQVYFGDLHSRLWRYSPSTPGVAPVAMADLSSDSDQPFANGLSLLDFGSVPQVYASSGRDSRVATRTNPPRFRMYGYSDGPSGNPVAPFAQLFAVDFPVNYRGNSSPAAGFIGGDTDNDPTTPDVVNPIVFFTGLSFSAGSDPNEPCISRFDSVLFALQGLTGLAALDLNSSSTLQSDDAYTTIAGQVLQNPHITTEGTLVIDRGLGAQTAPAPPAPPQQSAAPPTSSTTTSVSTGIRPGTQAFIDLKSTTTPFRIGTAVCNVNP